MTLWASDLQSDSDLDSIRNSCDVFLTKVYVCFLLCGAPTLQCQFFWSMCDANFHLPQHANCSTCCLLCPTWDHCDQNLAAKIIHSQFCLWINQKFLFIYSVLDCQFLRNHVFWEAVWFQGCHLEVLWGPTRWQCAVQALLVKGTRGQI